MAVSFDEEPQYQAPVSSKKGGLSSLVIRLGLATDEQGAQKMLLAIAVIGVILSVAILFFGVRGSQSDFATPVGDPITQPIQ